MRICSKCETEKPLTTDFFHKGKNKKDGFQPVCKECRKQYQKDNKENISLYQKKYREEKGNKNLLSDSKKLEYQKKYREKNKKIIAKREKEYRKIKRIDNPSFKIINTLRSRLHSALQGKIKHETTLNLLGCNVDFLKKTFRISIQRWDELE